jgi:uncharacterized alkaline shock family protein YloU
MPECSVAGKSIVTRRAIVDVVRTAVQASYGVTSFSDPSRVRRLLRRTGLTRPGVRLTLEDGVGLDLYLKVAHGIPVAEVARQVDSAVRYSVRRIIGVEIARLGVHVDGLSYQPAAVHRAEAMQRAETVELGLEIGDSDGEPPPTGGRAAGETARRRRRAE